MLLILKLGTPKNREPFSECVTVTRLLHLRILAEDAVGYDTLTDLVFSRHSRFEASSAYADQFGQINDE